MSGSRALAHPDQHLTDRYVDAVVHALPSPMRRQAADDLRRQIGEQVLSAADPIAAERAALETLGDPILRAADYASQPQHLIGPALFGQYLRLLRTLLVAVPVTVTTVVAIVQGFTGESLGSIAGNAVGLMLALLVNTAFWTTLVFAIVERVAPDATVDRWTPDDLDPAPPARIPISDTLASVSMLVLLVALVGGHALWSPLFGAAGQPLVTALVLLLAAAIVLEIVAFAVGHWTVAQAWCNTVINVAFAAITAWLLQTQPAVTPQYLTSLGAPEVFAAGTAELTGITVVVIVVCLFDTVMGWYRALR